jgi:hypothetical protein
MKKTKNIISWLCLLIILDFLAGLSLCLIPIDNFKMIPTFLEEGHYYVKVVTTEKLYYYHQGKMIHVTDFEKLNDYFLVKDAFVPNSFVNFYQLTSTNSLLEHLLDVFH